MKYVLFLVGWSVIVSAMNEHCISGPEREYSFLYCPANSSNMSAAYQGIGDVRSNYYYTVLSGTAIATSLTLAGGLCVGRGNHTAYVVKSAVLAGMTSLLFGGMLLSFVDPSQLRNSPHVFDTALFWCSILSGYMVGCETVGFLRRNMRRDI
jgi:hypothetical protein